MMRSLRNPSFKLFGFKTIIIAISLLSINVNCESIREFLSMHPDLEESEKVALQSSVLEEIADDQYGGALTMMFPTNQAWDNVSDERKAYLLNPDNKEDLQTLLLFSTTDSAVYRDNLSDGESIITLLGVEAVAHKYNNSICVLDYDGNEQLDCTNVVEWDNTVDEGVAYVIDKVIYPQELLEDPNFPS